MAALARAEILRPEPPPGLRAPARPRRRLPGPAARRARAAARARRRRPAADRRGAGPDRRPAHAHAAPRRRRRRPAAARGRATPRSRAARSTAPSATCDARSTSRRRPSTRPQLLLDLGEVEALTRGPQAAEHLREAYDGLTDVHLRVRAANALGRALLFTSSPAEGAAVAREAARALPPELADEALGLEAFALMGVPFGALDPERDAARRRRTAPRPLRTMGEKGMGAIAALEWNQSGGHVDEVVALSLAALAGGELSERDPNLLTLAALLPMIVGDRDEALQIFDLAMLDAHRRGSLFAITGMYLWRGFTLFWRGDLIDAEEELTRGLRPGRDLGLRARTRCSGTPPTCRGA